HLVDYKTGGRDEEPLDLVRERHLLQAQCYAYALLCQGYRDVELRFVRVERADAQGQPQEVSYRFSAKDRSDLAQAVLSARG
uniref:PD-(D/E)XK nuclease family protein n=1 Tax=Paraeggerthella hominis TaxID=2897351 RepID=UPI003D0E8FB7